MPNPPEQLATLQQQFAAHIRDPEDSPAPEGLEDRRMGIYRELFFNNLNNFLASNFPVIRKLYEDQRWEQLIRDFFTDHRCHTPLFPELPREFLKYLQDERPATAGDPPFLLELAHYEWAELAVSIDDAEIDEQASNPDGDLLTGIPFLSPLAWLLSYQFPVHRIRPDYQPTEAPANPSHLLVYRNRQDKVRFMELNAVSSRLAQLLKGNKTRTGLDCLNQIALELGQQANPAVIEGGRQQLEKFLQRDIIPGMRIN